MKIRASFLVMHMVAFLILLAGYEQYVSTIYASEGFAWHPDDDKWPVAMACVFLLSLLTPVRSDRASSLFFQMVLMLVLLPMLVLFYAEDQPGSFVAQVVAAYVLTIALRRIMPVGPPRRLSVSPHRLRRIFFIAALAYIALIVLMGGGKYLNFDLTRVYEVRADAASNLPGIFGYISPVIGKVVVPIALVLSILYKKYTTAFAFLVCSVLIFALTAHKAPLFYPLLILGVYFASARKHVALVFAAGMVMMLLVSMADFWIAQTHEGEFWGWIGKLVMRRVFFLPSQLNYMYYDFFINHDYVLFSNSKITFGLVDYPYDLPVTHVIGREYFDNESMGANTGWFGSGYMQAGFAGLLLYGAVVAGVFKYVDVCAQRSGNLALSTAAVVVPMFALITSSDLLTTFFTHGLYINLCVLACLVHKESVRAYRPHDQRASALRHAHFRQAVP
jgi:hypothetical protein